MKIEVLNIRLRHIMRPEAGSNDQSNMEKGDRICDLRARARLHLLDVSGANPGQCL